MGAVMLKLLLVAPVRVVADAVRAYAFPGLLTLTFAKVATPLTAATVVVPARIPLAGLVPIASVMLVVAVVTVLPWASWTVTCTPGVFIAPAAALLGCTVKTTFAAGPARAWPALVVAPPPPAALAGGAASQNAQGRRGARDGSSCCGARGWLGWVIGRTLRDGTQSRSSVVRTNANGLSLPLEWWRRYRPR